MRKLTLASRLMVVKGTSEPAVQPMRKSCQTLLGLAMAAKGAKASFFSCAQRTDHRIAWSLLLRASCE